MEDESLRLPAHIETQTVTEKTQVIPSKRKSESLFKKSHTCGSLFAKCSCYNENGEHRVPLLQTFSHPTPDNCYFIQKKISSSNCSPNLTPHTNLTKPDLITNADLIILNTTTNSVNNSIQNDSNPSLYPNKISNIPPNSPNRRLSNPELLTNPDLIIPEASRIASKQNKFANLVNQNSVPKKRLSNPEFSQNPNLLIYNKIPNSSRNLIENSNPILYTSPNKRLLNQQSILNPNFNQIQNKPNQSNIKQKKALNSNIYSPNSQSPPKSPNKRLSNPELPQPLTLSNQKQSSKSIQNLYLHHPEIPYPIFPIPKRHPDKFLAKSVPRYFESNFHALKENSKYISDYSENFLSNKNFEYHKFNAISYTQNCEDPAQKYYKESGIFGPMGNGAAAIRKNSNISNNDCEIIRKISKSVCTDSKRRNSEDYEYLKTVVTQLKKEVTDYEIKVGNMEKDLRMKETEVLKLQREVHKLKSVLQQATTFYDTDILASLQEQHGMANRTNSLQQSLSSNCASKKQGVSAESSECTGQASDIQIARYEKDFRSKQLIKDAIMDNNFLKKLDSSQVREIVDSVYSKDYPKGSFVICEGEAGAHLFVSAEGEYEVIKDGNILGKMGPGKAFGELAILYNCTRTASIQAVTECRVWVLDRKVFQQIMMRTGLQRRQDNINFLRSVPLLENLNCDVLAKIADVLEVEFYPAGAYIIRQGASGDTFFIISSGNVKVTQRITGRLGDEEIRTLGRGDYFGEQALLKEDSRTASIIALNPGVECLTLDRDSFIQLIGDLSELQEKDYGDGHRVLTRPNSSASVCLDAQVEYDYIGLDDLEVIATLGIGGFGRVELVQYTYDHTLTFALKCLKKQHIVDTQQQEHVFSEKNIMLSCRSPFICRLFRTYRDSKYIYMLLEACLGGEVWTILRDRGYFDDHTTRFITSCVIEAFSYLHTRGIIYRDLKPENLLLDSQGYVKLVDFGFSKRLGYSSKTWTFCGTPEYVSPETILNKGHDRAVDYWGLGILMHELLTGSPPFTAADPMTTYNLILKGIDMVDFPRHITRAAQSLIKRLCKDSPSERLGYQRGGIQDIKKHKWFQSFDWDGLKSRTLPAPINHAVRSPQDTSNFDCYTKDNDVPPDEFTGWDLDF